MKDKLKKVKKPAKLLKTKKKKLAEPKMKPRIQDMSVDEFMSGFMNEESDNGKEVTEELKKPKTNSKSKAHKKQNEDITKNKDKKDVEEEEEEEEEDDGDDDDDDDDDDDNNEDDDDDDDNYDQGNEFTKHKKQLDGLKESDPEFYKFLEENDQELLNFNDSDSEEDEKEKNEKFHKPPDELEVGSDESDYEVDDEIKKKRKGGSNCITTEMVTAWQDELMKGTIKGLREVSEAFHAAVVSVSPEGDATCSYKVEGAVAFNSVTRMCMVDFLPGVLRALRLSPGFRAHPKVCKNWAKVKPVLRSYFNDLAELSRVSSPNMLTVLLKHIHQMSPFIVCFPAIAPKFLKRVTQLWAMDEDVVRVLAFLCALKLANLRPSLLRQALKIMYITYVKNTKFVSPSTLPGINFMRQSLCELFALDNTFSYHLAFIYIRQLAIHLRNAITLKKKDAYRTVYNWAFISSLHLWAELFGIVSNDSPLKTLTYPLVQIIVGTIKLIPSAQYFPLRFHCIRILTKISNKCRIFIPILPFILEVLRDFNFNREHKKLSMKPMDLTCLLRCSKSQMKENGFKDAIIENIQELLMEYLAMECHRVSFPDLMVPCVIEMKHFLKTCTVANYNKKLKAILDKIAENSKFLESERKKLTLKLDDPAGVEAAETAIRLKDPPFLKYYESWKKIHFQQQARKITNNAKVGDFKLPVLYKLEKKRSRIDTKPAGPTELFPSDDEDSDGGNILKDDGEEREEDEVVEEPPVKRKKLKKVSNVEKKIVKKVAEIKEEEIEDNGDILLDLKYSDLI